MFVKLKTEKMIRELLNSEGKKCDRAVSIQWHSLGPSEHHRSITKILNGSIAQNLLLNSCHLNLFSYRSRPSLKKKLVEDNQVVIVNFSQLSLPILLLGIDHL